MSNECPACGVGARERSGVLEWWHAPDCKNKMYGRANEPGIHMFAAEPSLSVEIGILLGDRFPQIRNTDPDSMAMLLAVADEIVKLVRRWEST